MKNLLYLLALTMTLISCDRELSYGSDFDFEIRNINETPTYVNSLKLFQLEIVKNISINKNNEYFFSYKLISGELVIKNGSQTLIEEEKYLLAPNELAMIDLSAIASNTDQIIIEYTLVNNGITRTKQILITPEFASLPFTLAKVNDFSVKNTKNVNFQYTLIGGSAASIYEIRYITNNLSKILKTSGEELQTNVWLPMTLNGINLYTNVYKAETNVNANLEVQVRDNFGQIQSITYNITVFPLPILTSVNIELYRSTPVGSSGAVIRCGNGYTRCTITASISGGATLIKTKIIIKNKLTNTFETILVDNSTTINTIETFTACGINNSQLLARLLENSKFASQQYTIQVQDSDGVWSIITNGTVVIN